MKQGRRRLSRRLAKVFAVVLAGVFVIWLTVLGLGISIPLDGFRNSIETVASRALGRAVHIDGTLALRPTIGPTITAYDVRITGPSAQGELLRAGRISVRLAPISLLRGKPLSRWLLIEDASIDLATRWAAASRADPVEPAEGNAAAYFWPLSAGAELLDRQPELQELVMHRLELSYRDDDSGQAYRVKLDELSAQTGPGQAFELTLRDQFQQQPYAIGLTGGELADLLTPTGPWPVRVWMSFADSRLSLSGTLEALRQEPVLKFELAVDWPAEFAGLEARFGQGTLTGELSLAADRGHLLSGELRLPALDAVARFTGGAEPAEGTAGQPGTGGKTLADTPIVVPLTVSIADVPLYGRLLVNRQVVQPLVELTLSAGDADAGRLLATLTGATGVRGRFRRVGLQASIGGGAETGFANRLALALRVDGAGLSYGNAAGERPIELTLDELALTLPAGESVLMNARGTLLDESFSANLMAGGLEEWLREGSWPIELTAAGAGAVLDVSGSLAAGRADTATRLNLGVFGERIGDLAAWLGVSPCASGSYTLRGQLVLAADIGRLQFLQVHTDSTRLNAELDWSGYDQTDFLHAVLHFEELKPADMADLIPLIRPDPDAGGAGAIAVDLPILPKPVAVVSADIELGIAHILFKMVDISDVLLSARIRQGRLQHSPFHAQLGNASFQGYLDPTAEETTVVFENVDYDSPAGERMDKLFSSAVRLVGNSAVVPLRWIFSKKVAEDDLQDCQRQGVEAAN
jgi:hypothetical protein